MNMWTLDLALLILRLTVAYVMIFAAWKNTENIAAWTWTINETAIMFRNYPDNQRNKIARISAFIGVGLMYAGGLSILLGIEPRLGGLAIAVFCVLGMKIHAIRRDEAKQAADAGNQMGWSAYSAHIAAGLKNWGFVGAGLFFALVGVGRYGLGIDFLGRLCGIGE